MGRGHVFVSMLSLVLFAVGIAVGSFLNVLVVRIPAGEKVFFGRSRCRSCLAPLGPRELIPVLSFLLQRGRCRRCRGRIALHYPLVELATGLLFALSPLAVGASFGSAPALFWATLGYALFVFSVFIVIFMTDLLFFLIPDRVILPAIAAAIAAAFANRLALDCRLPLGVCAPGPGLSALAGAAFFLALVLVSRGSWMGLGDVKLAAFMGLVLGLPKLLVAIMLAFLIGSAVGLILIVAGRKTLSSEVPFGTFLALASVFVVLRGEWLLRLLNLAPFRW